MSWREGYDPVAGDAKSCDALDLVIVPRVRDLGGFSVRRALPHGRRQMVGPFIFFDQMGPAQFIAGQGMDVRPHPHIGLATVTYLFEGSIFHRDSEGNALEIAPGAMNLMTAGRGIAHSERTPAAQRASGQGLYGIQSWIALPRDSEEIAPSFQHFDAGGIADGRRPWARGAGHRRPRLRQDGAGRRPVALVLCEVKIAAGRSAPLDNDYEERAVYVVDGEVEIAGDSFEGPRLLIFRPGDRITIKAKSDCRLMFLGGAALEGPRYIWWNFVSSRKERIESAKEDWKQGRFAAVPDESEFIPLPDEERLRRDGRRSRHSRRPSPHQFRRRKMRRHAFAHDKAAQRSDRAERGEAGARAGSRSAAGRRAAND